MLLPSGRNPADKALPELSRYSKPQYIPDERKIALLVSNNEQFHLFERFSSMQKLIRVTAHCLRFINNIRRKKDDNAIKLSFLDNNEI